MATKKTSSTKKSSTSTPTPIWLIATTAIVLTLNGLLVYLLTIPQCPAGVSDVTNCIVGANVGAGLLGLVVVPVLLLLGFLWLNILRKR